jgi:hypothetical protein
MIRHTLVAGIALASVTMIAPAVAKPPPAGVWEQLHFKLPNGKTKTVTQQLQIVRADYAATACGVDLQKNGAGMAAYVQKSHPELSNATFVGADCATDKSGQIKIAVGAWPAGGK